MLFEDFSVPSKIIKSNGRNVIEVRGLSFADLSELVNNHKPDVDKIIDLWKSFDREGLPEEVGYEMMAQFAFEILHKAPGIITNVISICADCPEHADKVARLPLSVQVASIEAIIKLTSDDFGGMKPMMGKIMGIIEQNAPEAVMSQLQKAKMAQSGSSSSTPS